MPKQYVNPPSLFPSLPHGFSQAVVASGGRTVQVSGQTAWNADKALVGGADLEQQAKQSLHNLTAAMEACGGALSDVVSLRIYVVDYSPEKGTAVGNALREFFPPEVRPASSWIGVAALADPGFLIEIEATAALE
jgi:2-iminobutanoate/2-iminopropanoate deaminase